VRYVRNEMSGEAGSVVQAGHIGEVHVWPQRSSTPAPRQLPAGTTAFTGREADLAKLDGVPIMVVSGPPGVGKTALAVHWARLRAADFPDGQFYVDLQGYGPDRPLSSGEVLVGFLRALGVPGEEVPETVAERTALFRTLLDGRRVMLVLDNADSEEQVRPLLPGGAPAAVVITSRDALSGLVVHHGAAALRLDVLDPSQALDLLRALVGDRVDREHDAASRVLALCGGLPLALRIVASRASVPLSYLAEELADEREHLDLLDAGADPRSAVRVVLSWSYQKLPTEVARAYRLLGVHTGRDFDLHTFTALVGRPRREATGLLVALTRAHLVAEGVPGRFGSHDLLRAYAAELCDSDADRSTALLRLADHYLHTADRADRLITPNRYRIPLDGEARSKPEFADYDAALAWLDTERHNLVALCRMAAPELGSRYWQLAYTLRGYFYLTKHLAAWIETHRLALAACLRAGDRRMEARIRNDLGCALLESGDDLEAEEHYEAALLAFEELGDRHGMSNSLANKAVLLRKRCELPEALRLNRLALDYYLEVGARRNTAIAWRSRARMNMELGRWADALDDVAHALEIFAVLGVSADTAKAHNVFGLVHSRAGNREQSERAYTKALKASRECGSRYEAAEALRALGDLAAERSRAERYWREAVALYRSLGSRKAAEVESRYATFGG
jgi:tetratricopeptide (TPR) repeat protein